MNLKTDWKERSKEKSTLSHSNLYNFHVLSHRISYVCSNTSVVEIDQDFVKVVGLSLGTGKIRQ